MARAIWTGTVGFGLVQIPVGLHTAEDHDELGIVLRERGARDGGSGGCVVAAFVVEQRLIAVGEQPGDELGEKTGELFLLRLGDDGDARHAGSV